MTKEEFCLLNSIYNESKGRRNVLCDMVTSEALAKNGLYKELCQQGLIDDKSGKITAAGLEALLPYRVDNAVIMAAGASTRFIPLSLEQPKGLFEVKGEKLIERQIKQLIEAGIEDITIVLGYKKEMFFYLKDKYNVKFIFNSSYNVKNNIETIILAENEFKNTYLCSCDDYFTENPFNTYEYQSFYAGMHVDHPTREPYVTFGDDDRILQMKNGELCGHILIGHSFWKKEFADSFLSIAKEYREIGTYDSSYWENLVEDKLGELPEFYIKRYGANSIYEFDFFEELRAFDTSYMENAHSKIISNICKVFGCAESDIIDFKNVNEGMTNTSFIFKIKNVQYIYRHPGDGTENIINRRNEKSSLELAKKWDIDPTYVYMDVAEGWKISVFVKSFREPDYESFDDSKKVLKVLKRLHSLPITADYGMRPWEDAIAMENLLKEKDPTCFEAFEPLKEKIGILYRRTIGDGVKKCFCHGDTYKPNWLIEPDGNTILIDWEYSGMSDPGIDVGYYIVDAMYDIDKATQFIKEYLGQSYNDVTEFHYFAYTAIIAYYWFVWAMYRESCGAVMGEALFNWYEAACQYAGFLLGK